MAKKKQHPRSTTVRVLNPAPPEDGELDDNPSVRYTTVPVDEDGDGDNDISYVVRGGRKREAVRRVANAVPEDAMIDLDKTRTFATKHEAEAHGRAVSPRIANLARILAEGGR